MQAVGIGHRPGIGVSSSVARWAYSISFGPPTNFMKPLAELLAIIFFVTFNLIVHCQKIGKLAPADINIVEFLNYFVNYSQKD